MSRKVIINELILLLGVIIWGAAFVFQKMGGDYVEVFTFNVERSFVAFAFLVITYYILKLFKINKKEKSEYRKKDLIIGSLICGIFLALGMSSQQMGIILEGAGKSGFITSLYIIFVPLISLFFKKKPSLYIIISCLLSLVGLYIVNGEGGLEFSKGTWLLLVCALAYAFQILTVSRFTNLTNPFLLCAGQFLVCGIIQLPLMFIFEDPNITQMLKAYVPVLFTGVLSSGVAYTIQIYCQRHISPSIATIIMSMESCFSLLFACLILDEKFDGNKLIGCGLILIAILLAQIPRKGATS